jgi:hypothetical protein
MIFVRGPRPAIMNSEAAARPQKLQKQRQMVHRFGKTRREWKVSTTGLNGVFQARW